MRSDHSQTSTQAIDRFMPMEYVEDMESITLMNEIGRAEQARVPEHEMAAVEAKAVVSDQQQDIEETIDSLYTDYNGDSEEIELKGQETTH